MFKIMIMATMRSILLGLHSSVLTLFYLTLVLHEADPENAMYIADQLRRHKVGRLIGPLAKAVATDPKIDPNSIPYPNPHAHRGSDPGPTLGQTLDTALDTA